MSEPCEFLQLYFMRFSIKARDVAIVELEEALRQAGNQLQLYGQFTSVLLGVATILGSILATKEPTILSHFTELMRLFTTIAGTIILGFFLMMFVELQKGITLNSRKVITLRGVLKLDYSSLHLTLPNWRIEGATNPFAVKLFPGWGSATTFPLWIGFIVVITMNYFIITNNFNPWWFPLDKNGWWVIAGVSCCILAFLFRKHLFELHESYGLRFIYCISKILKIKLLDDFSVILFRAKLGVSEIQRLKLDTQKLESILVANEDQRFYKHRGIDYISLGRALLSQVPLFREKYNLRRSGASTISMQLARTLLISEYNKKLRRKIMEFLIAKWIEKQFSKKEIINLYMSSVRFAEKVMGLPAAIKHYYGAPKRRLISPTEAFYLVERLSNVRNRIIPNKIAAQIKITEQRIGYQLSRAEIIEIYNTMVKKGILTGKLTLGDLGKKYVT